MPSPTFKYLASTYLSSTTFHSPEPSRFAIMLHSRIPVESCSSPPCSQQVTFPTSLISLCLSLRVSSRETNSSDHSFSRSSSESPGWNKFFLLGFSMLKASPPPTGIWNWTLWICNRSLKFTHLRGGFWERDSMSYVYHTRHPVLFTRWGI